MHDFQGTRPGDPRVSRFGGLAQKIDVPLLKTLHERVGHGLSEHFDAIPGQFRTDPRVVGTYRCPDSEDVPELVDHLCVWLQEEFDYCRGNQSIVDAVIQAIVTHIATSTTSSGNCRIGRRRFSIGGGN